MSTIPSFHIFKAGAGSGKTFNLVKQYLMMAFDANSDEGLKKQFRAILAITFTNKAANEMKERILKNLIGIAKGENVGGMDKQICGEMGINAQELQRRAKIVSSAVLHNYSDLSVSTIDSFMQRIVRTFAHDLNLSGNFGIELDSKYVGDYVVNQLMSLAGTEGNDELTKVLCQYGYEQLNNAKSSNIERQLSETVRKLFQEEAEEYLRLLSQHKFADFLTAYEKLKKDNELYITECRSKAKLALDDCVNNGLDEKDFPGGSRSGICHWLKNVAENGAAAIEGNVYQSVLNAHEERSFSAKKGGADLSPVISSVMAAIDFVLAGRENYNTRCMLKNGMYSLAVLGEMKRLKDEYYHDNEVIDLVEVSHKISDEVKNQPAPFLFERLGERYKHFLIDEFQDTSKEQWHNLLPLIVNGVSEGHKSLVVGDAKQAIYRFRQGDVKQFVDLPQVTPYGKEVNAKENEILAQPNISTVTPLSDNYRSRKAVVEFNNDFFEWLIRTYYNGVPQNSGNENLLPKIYLGKTMIATHSNETAELVQHSKKEGGYVEISFWQKNSDSQEEGHPEGKNLIDETKESDNKLVKASVSVNGRENKEQANSKHVDNALYKAAFDVICEQHSLGYKFGDITVLSNRNNVLSDFSSYLGAQTVEGLPVRTSSSEALLLKNSMVVLLIRSLLQYLQKPSERHVQLLVLDYLRQLGKLSDDYTPLFFEGVKDSCDDSIAAGAPTKKVFAFDLTEYLHKQCDIKFKPQYLKSLSLYDCCEELLRCFRLDKLDSSYVASFLNFVASYSSGHRQDLGEFLDFLDDKLDNLSSNAPIDPCAVRLMTVHKSKGLESPIVIYLLPVEKVRPKDKWVKVKKDLADIDVALVTLSKDKESAFDDVSEQEQLDVDMDNVNRTYVAFTRPKDKLYLLVEDQAAPKNATSVTLNQQLRAYADNCVQNGSCVQEDDIYRFGDSQERKEDKTDDADDWQESQLERLGFDSWVSRIKVANKGDAVLGGLPDERIQRGLQMHELLSHVYHQEDAAPAVERYAKANNLTEKERDILLSQLNNLVSGIATAQFFAPEVEVKNECSLWFEGQERRPDRVAVTPSATWVIDFKTGSANPKYRDQVTSYCRAIQSMGYPSVTGYLIYLGDEKGARVEQVV
jgi:ATP-dependent exoDNAse (exonuclease V) beta subunit